MSLYNDQFSISLQNATLILPCSEKLNPQRNKKFWKKKLNTGQLGNVTLRTLNFNAEDVIEIVKEKKEKSLARLRLLFGNRLRRGDKLLFRSPFTP